MELVHQRAAGIDISKRDAKVALRVPGKRKNSYQTTVTTWGATTNAILALRDMLLAAQVTTVVMEATSDYWKPFYFVFEGVLPVMLVNAKAARNIPGRKTDVSDAAWLAQLGAHELLRASYVPPEQIRRLRDLTRARTIATQDRSREMQRLEKFLESSGIKLSGTVSDLMGASSRAMLEALIAGERDPQMLASLAKGKLKAKNQDLVEALTGRFEDHHAFLVQMHLDRYDSLTRCINDITARIDQAMSPFQTERELLTTIPGVSTVVADVVISETGASMATFETPGRLASWAGLSPGANESAGKVKSTRTQHGDSYLKGALGQAALNIARHPKNTYLGARYRRIAARRGRMKAIVATEHAILAAIWQMFTNGVIYDDLGKEFFTKQNPIKAKNNAIKRLHELGYTVTLSQATAA